MELIERDFIIESDMYWDRIPINKLREELDRLEEIGTTHIEIEVKVEWDTPILDIWAIQNRLETEQECNERLSKEKEKNERIEKREREQLRKLQEKYKI
jgi:hypothetical protein